MTSNVISTILRVHHSDVFIIQRLIIQIPTVFRLIQYWGIWCSDLHSIDFLTTYFVFDSGSNYPGEVIMDHQLQPARVDPRKQALLEARFGGRNKVGATRSVSGSPVIAIRLSTSRFFEKR